MQFLLFVIMCGHNYVKNLSQNHTYRGVYTFADNPHSILQLPLPIIQPEGYPETPVTIGKHILKRRIDLVLF